MLKHHQKFSLKRLLETAVKKPRAIILDNSYTILVYSMPISLAIAGGMAIGNYWNIILTNFNSEPQSYQDLIKINQVKYYF